MNKALLGEIILANLPQEACQRWEQQGRPLGMAVRDIAAGEVLRVDLTLLALYSQLGIPQEFPLGEQEAR